MSTIEAEAAEAKAKAEAEEAARKRAEELRPDKEKLLSVADAVKNITVPAVSEWAQGMAARIEGILDEAEGEIRRTANKLGKKIMSTRMESAKHLSRERTEMRIEDVTEFVADDGKRFRSRLACCNYEKELAEVEAIMQQFPRHDLPNGKYVFCDPRVLRRVKSRLWDMVLNKYGESWPKWQEYSADDVSVNGIVSRVLSDSYHGPLETAWLFLMRCDFSLGRVYDQPYFVNHPNEASLLEQSQ